MQVLIYKVDGLICWKTTTLPMVWLNAVYVNKNLGCGGRCRKQKRWCTLGDDMRVSAIISSRFWLWKMLEAQYSTFCLTWYQDYVEMSFIYNIYKCMICMLYFLWAFTIHNLHHLHPLTSSKTVETISFAAQLNSILELKPRYQAHIRFIPIWF